MFSQKAHTSLNRKGKNNWVPTAKLPVQHCRPLWCDLMKCLKFVFYNPSLNILFKLLAIYAHFTLGVNYFPRLDSYIKCCLNPAFMLMDKPCGNSLCFQSLYSLVILKSFKVSLYLYIYSIHLSSCPKWY